MSGEVEPKATPLDGSELGIVLTTALGSMNEMTEVFFRSHCSPAMIFICLPACSESPRIQHRIDTQHGLFGQSGAK